MSTAATSPLPTRQAKRTDSAVSLSFSPPWTTHNKPIHDMYSEQWSAHLGLEEEWGYVVKDSREEKPLRWETKTERKTNERYEKEWDAYLGLDRSGEF